MSTSVARRVGASGAIVLVGALVLTGVGTAVLLHSRERGALDQALLAAAHGRAHPDIPGEVEVEHSRSPVDAWLVAPGQSRVPAEAVAGARRSEGPVFLDVGDERVVLLPFEAEDRHLLAAASAPRVTVARSVGPFAAIYTLIALLASIAGTLVQARVVRRAFVPLDRAREEAARVVTLGQGRRLTPAGPVEVRSLLDAINDLLGRLDAAHNAQARFTAEAAHELRTPVAAMLGELDVALRGDKGPETCRAALTSVREDVERLRRLVDGLLALARLDAGHVDGGREPVRAAELAAAVLALEASGLSAARCPVRMDVLDDPELEVHRPLVEAALGNLLRNAARHAPGAPVVLQVARQGALAVFDVDDGGPGVPEDRDGLFDRFARGGEARRADREGLGLGLPIAREVARRHGGDCVLLPSPLGGTRARLTLPALAADTPDAVDDI